MADLLEQQEDIVSQVSDVQRALTLQERVLELETCLTNEDTNEDTSNIALCEDYEDLQCNTQSVNNDCATLQELYVLDNDDEEALVPEACLTLNGKSQGHCIAFLSIQNGTCCSNGVIRDSNACDKIGSKLFESPGTKEVVCPAPTKAPTVSSFILILISHVCQSL